MYLQTTILACDPTCTRTSTPFSDAEKVQYRGRYAGSAFAENKINYSVAWNWNNLTNEEAPFIETGNHSFASDPST